MRTIAAITLVGLATTAVSAGAAPIIGSAGFGLQTTQTAQENNAVFWDGNSWDSRSLPDGSAFNPCNIGALASGGACSLNPIVLGALNLASTDHSLAAGNAGFEFWGSAAGGADGSFGFDNVAGSGWFEFDLLAEFTGDWAVNEVGWYAIGNPNERHVIFGGTQNMGTTVSTFIQGDFGLYYRNTADPTEIFYTQSAFNTQGTRQQFAAFQSEGYTILGVEDIFSNVLSTTGALGTADYDFNDVIFGFREAAVPEPGTLLFLGMGIAGAVAHHRRRKLIARAE